MRRPLTEKERVSMMRSYTRRENQNYHAENNLALIKRFGTKPQLKKAEAILKAHKQQGYLTGSQSDWLYRHGSGPHYRKIMMRRK